MKAIAITVGVIAAFFIGMTMGMASSIGDLNEAKSALAAKEMIIQQKTLIIGAWRDMLIHTNAELITCEEGRMREPK